MSVRESHGELVAQFLARGGCIHRVPGVVQISRTEVIEYLEQQKISVQRISREPPGPPRYLCVGKRTNVQELVSIANRLRSEQGLPAFQLDTSP